MSPVRKRIIDIIKLFPDELEEIIKNKSAFDIIKEITQIYVEKYGVNDLSENDRDCIRSLIHCGNNQDFFNKIDEKGAL